MPSSFTTRNRLNKQSPGENISSWGTVLNQGVFDLADTALDGVASVALSGGTVTLTSANGLTDQARSRALKFTGTGGTVIIPGVEKWYLVTNTGTSSATITTGAGGTAVVLPGETIPVVCDASDVKRLTLLSMRSQRLQDVADPTNPQDAATKAYADALAFTANAGVLPAQTGNSGKAITTNGTTASWGYFVSAGAGLASVAANTLTVTASAAADVRTGTASDQAVTPVALTGSAAFITLTDASTVAWDASLGYNAEVTLGGNRTIGKPTNLQDGMTYTLDLVQDATGSRVPTWNSVWDWGQSGTPVLQTAAGKRDKVVAQYRSSTDKLYASFRKGA